MGRVSRATPIRSFGAGVLTLVVLPAMVGCATRGCTLYVPAEMMVRSTLHDWHDAAARGDADAYFSRMTGDAVFLGTDATERWDRDAFESFALPYFDGVEAWTYTPVETHVTLVNPGARATAEAAWADEVLWSEKYGYCRGTALLRWSERTGWRIDRYSLAFLVPNDSSGAVMDAIGPQARPATTGSQAE
jgi:hypothetical protein